MTIAQRQDRLRDAYDAATAASEAFEQDVLDGFGPEVLIEDICAVVAANQDVLEAEAAVPEPHRSYARGLARARRVLRPHPTNAVDVQDCAVRAHWALRLAMDVDLDAATCANPDDLRHKLYLSGALRAYAAEDLHNLKLGLSAVDVDAWRSCFPKPPAGAFSLSAASADTNSQSSEFRTLSILRWSGATWDEAVLLDKKIRYVGPQTLLRAVGLDYAIRAKSELEIAGYKAKIKEGMTRRQSEAGG